MSVIADLGEAPLQEISASRVFNYSGVQGWPTYTKFAFMAKVEMKHTYAVLINPSDCRGLLVLGGAQRKIANNARLT